MEQETEIEKQKNGIEVEPLSQEFVDFDTFSKSDFRVVKIRDCKAVAKSVNFLSSL